jgi:hypothetical protein
MDDTARAGKQNRRAPRFDEMQALRGFRNDKAKFKKSYFVVPEKGVSFSAVPTALLESEVWSVLGIYEIRFVTAILIAHARTGGCKNGRLVLTHKLLKARRIRGNRIRSAIDKLVSLGLLEVTHKGGPADPARYRVTFLPHIEELNGKVSYFPPGNDWIEIELEIIDGARAVRRRRSPVLEKNDFQRGTTAAVSGATYAPVDGTGTLVNVATQVTEESVESATFDVPRPLANRRASR